MIDFSYPYDLENSLANLQIELAKKIIKEDVPGNLHRIAGVDVSFSRGDNAVSAAVVVDLNSLEILEEATREVKLFFQYAPGFLGFREADAMVSVLNDLKSRFDVIMVNGHGAMHPRGFGLASQVGVMMDMPTIGLAKRLIAGNHIKGDRSSFNKEASSMVFMENEIVGAYLNRYYVSIGHKISLERALKVVKETSIYKTSEPIREAHILATKTFKKLLNE